MSVDNNHHAQPHPVTLARVLTGGGGQFGTFVARGAVADVLRAHTLGRLAQFVAQRMADATERHETSVRFTPADTPWASAACLEEAKRILAQQLQYTITVLESDATGQATGWRLSWA